MAYFSNNFPTMHYRTGTQQGEEYIKVHTNGYPEATIFKGNKEQFERATGIVVFDKRGKQRLTEQAIKKLNLLLNKQ